MSFERVDIPLGRMDVSEPDHEAPASTLRAVMNLRPAGPEERSYYTPIESDLRRGLLGGVYALGMQVRQRRGVLSDLGADSGQSLERQIRVTDNDIVLADEDQDWAEKSIHAFDEADDTRKAQFAQIGDDTFIAISNGVGVGTPEQLLVLRDDEVLAMETPALPAVTVAATKITDPAVDPGTYQVRYAWLFKDGTIGSATRPYRLTVGADTDVVGTDYFTLKFTLGTLALSEAWKSFISGVVVFLSAPYTFTDEDIDALMQAPTYRVLEITELATGAFKTWADTTAQIVGYEAFGDDDQNLIHNRIKAAACFSYNKRLILGDVSFDYRAPVVTDLLAAGSGTDYYLMLKAEIRTANGIISRYSEPEGYSAAEAAALASVDGILAYPDVRAERLRWYVSTDYTGSRDGATWDEFFTSGATSGITRLRKGGGNFAYANVVGVTYDLTVASPDETLEVTTANEELDHDVNRVLTSGTFRPFELKASGVLYVGAGPHDGVVGFAVNTIPISPGQYGDWPMLVLCRETISALTPGATIAWDRNEIAARKGCVGRYAFTNLEELIVFAARDGIWTLSPRLGREPISRPLHNGLTIDEFYACLSADVALGYLNDQATGRRELWVSTDGVCYAWALPYQTWFLVDRARRCFMTHDGRLFGVEATDRTVLEEAADSRLIEYFVRTTRQYLGAVGYRKRLRRFWIRQRRQTTRLHWALTDFNQNGSEFAVWAGITRPGGRDVTNIERGIVREPYLDIVGSGTPGQSLLSIGFEYEIRTPHRPPDTVPASDVVPPWSCDAVLVPILPDPTEPDGPGPDGPTEDDPCVGIYACSSFDGVIDGTRLVDYTPSCGPLWERHIGPDYYIKNGELWAAPEVGSAVYTVDAGASDAVLTVRGYRAQAAADYGTRWDILLRFIQAGSGAPNYFQLSVYSAATVPARMDLYAPILNHRSLIDSQPIAFTPDTWFDVRVVLSGESIRCYFDGALIIDAFHQANMHATQFGLGGQWVQSDGDQRFDDFCVTSLESYSEESALWVTHDSKYVVTDEGERITLRP